MIAFAALGDGDKAGELFAILNPINHASTRSGLYRYKVEPYVMAGRRLLGAPARGARRLDLVHGRGRLDVPRGRRVDPGLPPPRRRRCTWIRASRGPGLGFEIHFRYHSARYQLVVENPRGAMRGVTAISLDGQPVTGREIPLADDGGEHRIAVVLG